MARRMVVLFVLVVVLFVSSGCASMVYPNRKYVNHNRHGELDWIMFLLNMPLALCTGGLPWLIDEATGCAYKPLPEGLIRTEYGAIIKIPKAK